MLALVNADQMVMVPNIGMIEKEFHITDKEIGYLAGSCTLVGALFSLICGFLADKIARKPLLLYSVLLSTIPSFLSAFAGNYQQLFILRTMSGIGIGALFPIIFSYAGDAFATEHRPNVNASLSTAISVGVLIAMVLAGFTGARWGWRLPFILLSILNIAVILLFYAFAKEPIRGSQECVFSPGGYVCEKKIAFSDYMALFTTRTNFILFLQGLIGTVPWGAIPYFLVEFLQRFHGLTKEHSTLVFLLFGVGNILGIYVGGIAAGKLALRKVSYMPIFCAVTTLVGLAFTILTFNVKISSPRMNFFVICLLGLASSAFLSMTAANIKTMLMNVNLPEHRGRIFSIFNLTDSAGTGIGRTLGGVFSVALGSLGMALTVCTLFWFPCALILLCAAATLPSDIRKTSQAMQRGNRP